MLDRFYQAAKTWQREHVVRLTGSCPLIYPEIIDALVTFYFEGGYNYASKAVQPSFPDGLDVVIFRFSSLEEAWRETLPPSQREHVTPFIHQHLDRFRIGRYRNTEDFLHLRWTVDEPEEFALVKRSYESLYPMSPTFRMSDVQAFLQRNPELQTLNQKFERNEGLFECL
jgi:spore coat polysaccharide biosynthesis protein SpsF (cytidylyltransferase family)